MAEKDWGLGDLSQLRDRAEAMLAERGISGAIPSPANLASLIHELQVRRVELEIQNEALRAAQRELKLSRDLYADLFDFAPVGYVAVDGGGTILQLNYAAARMLGRPRNLLVGSPLARFQENLVLRKAVDQCLGGQSRSSFEVDLHLDSGAVLAVQVDAMPYRDPASGQIQCRMTLTDVNQLRRAREAAEEASQAKSRFLANVSHEIRTPMASIRGYSELLEDPDMSAGERLDYIAVIRRNSDTLLRLIDEILDLSRIESGGLTIRKSTCSPRKIVGDVLQALEVRVREKGLRMEVEYLEPYPAWVQTDPLRLQEILLNLLDNAVKFTERGQIRLRLSASRQDALLVFELSDTGIGIPPDKLAVIQQSLTQLDPTATRRYGGVGLGLTISRRLAQLLGGQIDIESQAGQGSKFTLRIEAPQLDAPEEAAPARPADRASQGSLRGRVLVVDDARELRYLVRKVLESAGLEVDEAENGQIASRKALLSMADRPYQIILMDIQMPVMDGLEATRRLRRAGWTEPILALTAHAMTGDRQLCLEAGCNDYIAKPVDRAALLDVLGRYVSRTAETAVR